MNEVIAVLAEEAPELRDALERARDQGVPHVILDSKIIAADWCGEKTLSVKNEAIDLWYSGKAHTHGGSIQALFAPDGFPLLPERRHGEERPLVDVGASVGKVDIRPDEPRPGLRQEAQQSLRSVRPVSRLGLVCQLRGPGAQGETAVPRLEGEPLRTPGPNFLVHHHRDRCAHSRTLLLTIYVVKTLSFMQQ